MMTRAALSPVAEAVSGPNFGWLKEMVYQWIYASFLVYYLLGQEQYTIAVAWTLWLVLGHRHYALNRFFAAACALWQGVVLSHLVPAIGYYRHACVAMALVATTLGLACDDTEGLTSCVGKSRVVLISILASIALSCLSLFLVNPVIGMRYALFPLFVLSPFFKMSISWISFLFFQNSAMSKKEEAISKKEEDSIEFIP
jgi:hypothetical protein